MFETGSRSEIPFLQTETREKEKNFPRGFFTSASLHELEKRPLFLSLPYFIHDKPFFFFFSFNITGKFLSHVQLTN